MQPEGARALLQKTCDSGSGPACNNLALNTEKAHNLREKALEVIRSRGIVVSPLPLDVRRHLYDAADLMLVQYRADPKFRRTHDSLRRFMAEEGGLRVVR